MECKDVSYSTLGKGGSGINRNIVECKVVSDKPAVFTAFVLIETLWNVKRLSRLGQVQRNGINRNIVECKADQDISESLQIFVLIETLWNVKYQR